VWTMKIMLCILLAGTLPATAAPWGDRLPGRTSSAQMQKMFGLSNQQMEQLKPILLATAQKLRRLQEDFSLSRPTRARQRNAILLEALDRIHPLLSAEQQASLLDLMQQAQARFQSTAPSRE